MYEIVTEKRLYVKNGKVPSLMRLAQQVSKGVRPEFTEKVTEKMKKLLTRCWSNSPQERTSFKEIFELLSSDFSYLSDKIDDDEVNNYINILKKSRNLNKSDENDESEKIHKFSNLLIDSSKIETNEMLYKGSHGPIFRVKFCEKDYAAK